MSEHRTVTLPNWVVRFGQLQSEYDKVKGVTFFAEFPDFLFCKLSNAESALASKDAEIRALKDALECWPLKRLISYARDNGESMMALLFEEVRDAALSTAPDVGSEEDAKRDIVLGDMSMLIRMMVTKHRRGKLDEEYCQKALDYLQRKGLQGNVLRAQTPTAPEGEKHVPSV